MQSKADSELADRRQSFDGANHTATTCLIGLHHPHQYKSTMLSIDGRVHYHQRLSELGRRIGQHFNHYYNSNHSIQTSSTTLSIPDFTFACTSSPWLDFFKLLNFCISKLLHHHNTIKHLIVFWYCCLHQLTTDILCHTSAFTFPWFFKVMTITYLNIIFNSISNLWVFNLFLTFNRKPLKDRRWLHLACWASPSWPSPAASLGRAAEIRKRCSSTIEWSFWEVGVSVSANNFFTNFVFN